MDVGNLKMCADLINILSNSVLLDEVLLHYYIIIIYFILCVKSNA